MTAIEYLKVKRRMTNNNCSKNCNNCPLSYENNEFRLACRTLENNHPEKAVEIVERWSKEHPTKTRQSEFLKLFPNSDIDRNGIISVCPKNVYNQYVCGYYDSCKRCRAEFWSEEIE